MEQGFLIPKTLIMYLIRRTVHTLHIFHDLIKNEKTRI